MSPYHAKCLSVIVVFNRDNLTLLFPKWLFRIYSSLCRVTLFGRGRQLWVFEGFMTRKLTHSLLDITLRLVKLH